jgi:hypothetical protein
MHTNMAGVLPPDVSTALARNVLGAGPPPPSGLSAEESRTYEQLNSFFTKGVGYGIEMGTQPQTLYGIADSPIGLAAWMINHDEASYQDIAQAFAGQPVGNLTRDEVLDNVTFYWLTSTGISSARLYWENKVGFFDVKNVSIPAAVSVFRTRSTRPRAAGPSRHIPISSTSTRLTGATTSPPGRSRRYSPPRSAARSSRCASEGPAGSVHHLRPYAPFRFTWSGARSLVRALRQRRTGRRLVSSHGACRGYGGLDDIRTGFCRRPRAPDTAC